MVRDDLLSPERQCVVYARIREVARELAREQEGRFTLPQLTRRILESGIARPPGCGQVYGRDVGHLTVRAAAEAWSWGPRSPGGPQS